MLGEIEVYERFLAKVGIEMTAFDWDVIWRIDWVWMDSQPKSQAEQESAFRARLKQNRP